MQGKERTVSSRFERLTDAVAWLGAAIATVLVLVTLVTVGYSVFKRYVLGTPVTWTDELSGYLVVAMVMLGAAEALRRGDHISVDLITSKIHGRTKHWLGLWSLAAVALFSAAIIYSSVLMVRFSYDFGIYSEGYLELSMWIPQAFLLTGAGLLLVVSLTRIMTLLFKR